MQAYLKAIAAAILVGLSTLATILVGSTTTFQQITDAQWVTVLIAVLTTLGGVWAIPNAPKATGD